MATEHTLKIINPSFKFSCDFIIGYAGVSNNDFNFSAGIGTTGVTQDWTGSGQISKSVGTGASSYANATFTVGFTSAYDGKVKLSLGSTATAALDQGRYMFDVNVDSGSTVFKLVNGNVYVYSGVSSAP